MTRHVFPAALLVALLSTAAFAQYIITGNSADGFTAVKGGSAVGTANQPIQTVIDAIRTDADGANVSIQFGNGTRTLDIGVASAQFSGTWGHITLLGKITSVAGYNGNYYNGTISLSNAVSVEIKADIRNSAAVIGSAVSNSSTGTINITEGTISATGSSGYAIYNSSTISITGGTISATGSSGYAVYHNNSSNKGSVILGGSPDIIGRIKVYAEGLSVITSEENVFNPGDKQYTVELNSYELASYLSYSNGAIAVKDGGNYLSNFTLYNPHFEDAPSLEVSGNELVIKLSLVYSVSSNGLSFTITKGNSGEFGSIQEAINSIKLAAGGEDCSIQFGNGTEELDLNREYITFNGGTSKADWGKITLLGRITSAYTGSYGVIYLNNGVSIESKADIGITVATSSDAIYNYSTGTVNISGGTLSVVSSATRSYTISNLSTGTINVTGGTILAAGGYAIYNSSTGTINVTGGIISSTSNAIYNSSRGTINVTGGTISTTGSYTIYNSSTGTINVTGGTISTTSSIGRAIYNNANGSVILGGNPNITGRIRVYAGKLNVIASEGNVFYPDDKQYMLELDSYSNGTIVAQNGKNYLSNFTLYSPYYEDVPSLEVNGDDLVMKLRLVYSVSSNGLSFTITKGNSGEFGSIQEAINSIKLAAGGEDCSIQFGNGTEELDLNREYITFDGGVSKTDWGKITLLGKITSAAEKTISLSNMVSIDSRADIRNTATGFLSSVYAISNSSTGTINITSGTISAIVGAISSGGTINITSGTISVIGNTNFTNYAISSRTINITGGTVKNTNSSGYAISGYIISLGGNPDITGRIIVNTGLYAEEGLSVIASGENIFNPGDKQYSVEFDSSYSNGTIAVKDGKNYLSNFTLYNPYYEDTPSLEVNGNDLIMVMRLSLVYSVSSNGLSFIITKGNSGEFGKIQEAINFIKTAADEKDCSIQFGNGTEELDIGREYITFDGGDWGKITLLGKITSAGGSTIYLGGIVSVDSRADIRNTPTLGLGSVAINYYSAGNINIISGTISATGSAISSISTAQGTINITGGTISSTGGFAIISANALVKITGGTVKSTESNVPAISTGQSVILGGSPDITGRIDVDAGRLSIIASGENIFNPGNKRYMLEFDYYSNKMIAVQNGAAFLSNFILYDQSAYKLATIKNDLVLIEVAPGAEITTVPTPILYSKTHNSITIYAITVSNGQTVEYAVSTSDIIPTNVDDWQTELTFTELSSNTTYYIFARSKGNDIYGAGAASMVLTTTTEMNGTTPILSTISSSGLGIAQNGHSFQIVGTTQATPIRIYNLRGNVLMSRTAMPNESISVAHLPKGVYVLKAGGKTVKVVR